MGIRLAWLSCLERIEEVCSCERNAAAKIERKKKGKRVT